MNAPANIKIGGGRGDRGNTTRRAEKAEGIAFARGWRAGFNAARSIIDGEKVNG